MFDIWNEWLYKINFDQNQVEYKLVYTPLENILCISEMNKNFRIKNQFMR